MKKVLIIFTLSSIIFSCQKDKSLPMLNGHIVTLISPNGFPLLNIPANRPITEEGVALGRLLFFDPILSVDRKTSCVSCHHPEYFYSDSGNAFSKGFNSQFTGRNSISLANVVYNPELFWTGGIKDLESQILVPIESPIEMNNKIATVMKDLNNSALYKKLFKEVYGKDTIETFMFLNVIGMFERSLISANSKYDKSKKEGFAYLLNQNERNGFYIFQNPNKGNCAACHKLNGLFSDFKFRNNGLDSVYADKGRQTVTFLPSDEALFKTPSLRNIMHTAPFMHDGRFKTIDEVLDFYNTKFVKNNLTDTALKNLPYNRMNQSEIADLKSFLATLTDEVFLKNQVALKPK